MAENVILVRGYNKNDERLALINYSEVKRYAGYMGVTESDDAVENVMSEAITDIIPVLEYKVCYRRIPIEAEGEALKLPFGSESKNLQKCLRGCDEIIVFAATVGLGVDRMIAKNKRIAMTKTLFMQAFGAERVEALCDLFCDEIKEEVLKEEKTTTPRFSPGYGDLALEVQKDIFKLLDCNRKIGISLGETLLMTPSKSVTAIFGIKNI